MQTANLHIGFNKMIWCCVDCPVYLLHFAYITSWLHIKTTAHKRHLLQWVMRLAGEITLLHPTPTHPNPLRLLLAMGKAKNGTTTNSQCLIESLRLVFRSHWKNVKKKCNRIWYEIWVNINMEQKNEKSYLEWFSWPHLVKKRTGSDSRRIWAKAETLSADMNNGAPFQ